MMTTIAAETIGARLAGRRPSRTRAVVAAGLTAAAAGVLVYKVLRAQPSGG
jgi:hypothetical protein